MKERGIILAVNSKNDLKNVREAFAHPDMVLKEEDFASFQVNWENKADNLLAIARELNVGLDSLVFVDDNPAERELVRGRLPEVCVPDMGKDVERYIEILDRSGCFEPVSLSQEDIGRGRSYQINKARLAEQSRFEDYTSYLRSLEMEAEIKEFPPIYYERIAQLTNNLISRRV